MTTRRFCPMLLIPCLFSLGANPGPGSADEPERVDRILTNLQARSDGLRDIESAVRFVEEDQVNLTERKKIGTASFIMTKPNPRFMIHFERTEADGVLGKQEWYLFDGQWLYETIERTGQVTQRQFAAPGETIDLFDLETTPFPLPFGQKKESILRHFNVSILPPQPGDPEETDHLRCVPKVGGRFHEKYDWIEFFVHRSLHLPTRVVVSKNDGFEKITADFPDLTERSLNKGLTASGFEPPREWRAKYKWVVEAPGADVESEPKDKK